MANIKESNRRRLCLCCGKPDARLLRTRDGRAIRVCHACEMGCEFCRVNCADATEREPINSEALWSRQRELPLEGPC